MPSLKIHDFDQIKLYTLKNSAGMELSLTNYGATVTSIKAPGRRGRLDDVVLGHSSLEGYLNSSSRPYFGATVGRYCNRIAGAAFRLGRKIHLLSANQGPNCLHGGHMGFDKVSWDAKPVKGRGWAGIRFSRLSPDGEEGFPGNLKAQVTYSLSDDNTVGFEARAVTDQATPVNLTNHCYFNLSGEDQSALGILSHRLWINAARYTPVDSNLIPTGSLAPVKGGPFDFSSPKAIGRDIRRPHPQLEFGRGYDHNFVLNRNGGGKLLLAARLEDPASGRKMEIRTTEPGIQFYSGNLLDGHIKGKSGRPYQRHAGLCLETQHFPDSPNQNGFPNTFLKPGKIYSSTTTLRFS